MIKYNHLMQDKIEKIIENESNLRIKGELSVLWPDFYEVQGFYLMRKGDEEKITNLNPERILDLHYSATVYEAGCSELRIQDYFDDLDELSMLKLAFIISEMWESKLKTSFPNEEFHIIIDDSEGDISLRFHKFHEGEESWLDEDNLEEYKSAILVRIVQCGISE
ncbi:hypothetical protein D6853_05725 [Butyrivibrio sp. X503]|uniref:hypothetical protein n=1 Tax=Butyrivibrio sp. X503 TaxID=2364878 RepID=UPI000EA91698|nr:hypothetical protein [Butyrivibrio sp. X503]RKM56293.1 hypothetical protein D6853_05725 [Butyrivibrio sp. X503]